MSVSGILKKKIPLSSSKESCHSGPFDLLRQNSFNYIKYTGGFSGHEKFSFFKELTCRSQWPCGLRHSSAAARLLILLV